MPAKKTLIFSIIAVLVAVVLIAVETLAWFALNNTDDTEDFNLGIVGDGAQGVNVTIVGGSGTTNEGGIFIYPGDYVVAKVDINNTEDYTQRLRVNVTEIAVMYMVGQDGYVFKTKDIETGDYFYRDSGERYDETAVVDTEAQFKSFIAPMTNAIQYAVYCQTVTAFDVGYTPTYLTSSANATSAQLAASDYAVFAQNVGLAVAGYSGYVAPVTIESDGTFYLASKTTISLYVLLYFDESFYPSTTIGGQTVEIRNSNAYMSQRISLKFGFSEVP